jgi:hypothetical protein
VPVTFAPPKRLVQLAAPGAHTCVWKYVSDPLRKKIACASAPY